MSVLRHWRLVVVCTMVIVVALGLVFWRSQSGKASVQETTDGMLVMVGKREPGSLDAGIGGHLTKVGRCVGLDGSLTIWPHGTRTRNNRLVVAGKTYGIGDAFEGGGGVFDQSSQDFDPSKIDAPKNCPVTATVILLSP